MRTFRDGDSAGHVRFAAGNPPGESAEVAAVSADLARSFPRCSGSSSGRFHACALGLPPEFHGESATLERLERLEQGTRGAAA